MSEREKPHTAEQAILDLVAIRGVGKTICPSEAAKAVSPENWRKLLAEVRVIAIRLAVAEKVSIYRRGKSVDPLDFKGVYRIGLPMEETDDPAE
ncbi:MAG: DUF3253 domain-containing protein [Pseudomonadota bacterium]